MPNVVGVLSGGGAKAAAQLGAWRAFDEAGVKPTQLIGTSMGAVVAAALAAGMTPADVLARLVEVGRNGVVVDPAALGTGLGARSLLQGDELRRVIEAVVPARSFDELALPLTVTAVDLDTGEALRYGARGGTAPLVDVLCAACALPVYFPPVTIDGRRLADGGLHEVVPLEPAAELPADLVLAVDVGPGVVGGPGGSRPGVAEAMGGPALLKAHDDAMHALMASITAARLAWWREDPKRPRLVYVRPPVERHTTFRFDQVERYAADGYEAARTALDSGT